MDLRLQETDFGLHILQQQNLTESLVFSPVSIQLALFLLCSVRDRRGETSDQIQNAFVKTDEEFAQYFNNIYASFWASSQNRTKTNDLYAFAPKSYLDPIKKEHNAGVTSVYSYYKLSEDATNKSARENTGEHINSEDLETLFISAVSFEWDWQNRFSSGTTSKRNFYASASSKRKINFLHAFGVHRNYTENDQFQVLSLPYKNNTYSLNIFLPKTRFGLKETLNSLDAATIQNLLSNVSETTVEIAIPKWKIETELKLKKTLQAIGITMAFDHNSIDNEYLEYFFTKEVTHNAFIEVDENGTNVAAANKMNVDISLSNELYSEDPKKFIANHPFLYVLSKDNHPLFIGLHY